MNVRRRASVEVVVKEHARIRARERFPGFKCARIVDEVHDALLAGRVSATAPEGFGVGRIDGLYVWTADGERAYGLAAGEFVLAVRTTLRRGWDGDGPVKT